MSDQTRNFERSGQEQHGQQAHNADGPAPWYVTSIPDITWDRADNNIVAAVALTGLSNSARLPISHPSRRHLDSCLLQTMPCNMLVLLLETFRVDYRRTHSRSSALSRPITSWWLALGMFLLSCLVTLIELIHLYSYAARLLGLTNVVASGQGTFTNPNSGPSADSGQVSDKSAAASSADEEDLEFETKEEDDAEAEPAAFLRKGKIRVTCDRCRLNHQQCDILDQPMSSFPLPPDDMVLVPE